MAASKIQQTIAILESYRGRDKIMRTLQFTSLMVAGTLNGLTPRNSEKLRTIAKQLGFCRVILRLFDDLPMLAYNIYAGGLGQKEKHPVIRLLSLAKGCVDQLFFPIEHIAWAAENKIIDISSAKWWVLSVAMWGISLCIDIIRSSIKLLQEKKQTESFRKDLISEQPPSSDGHHVQHDARELMRLEEQEYMTKLQIFKDFCDLSCAIHWFVPGFLWASKLPESVVGLLGTMSSILGFYAMLVQKRNAKKAE